MKEKYKENIKIDEQHMMQTIEISKMLLKQKENPNLKKIQCILGAIYLKWKV